MKYLLFPCVITMLFSCSTPQREKGSGSWLPGSDRERTEAIERQFRGFDMAMVETGYRYNELYWAGRDKNTEYALYQIDKIKKAIENGLERRPGRATSAKEFLNKALPKMRESVNEGDSIEFERGFEAFTAQCNAGHAEEKVSFFEVRRPLSRLSPVRKK